MLDGAMFAAISIARSGLAAGAARLEAAAGNIAGAGVTGRLPSGPANAAPAAYRPVEAVVRTLGGGDAAAGVSVTYRARQPATVRHYAPSAPFADPDGFVAAPDVDLAAEAVDAVVALASFRANAAVLRVADAMAETLLDIRA
jgi:flagellar basal-body rod protein FlgC